MKIFLSYRRDDSAGMTGRIYDRLVNRFGTDAVFMDVDAIPLGTDFRQHIREAVSQCDAFLAVIDKDWMFCRRENKNRLQNPGDFVRIELETALSGGMLVIPLLIGRTEMPAADHLPASLADLVYRNAARVDIGQDFHVHMDRIIRQLEKQDVKLSPPAAAGSTVALTSDGFPASSRLKLDAKITLQVEEPGLKPVEFDASEDRRIILGRSPQCDLVLPSDMLVSRKHAMIIYDMHQGWLLKELESTRGGVVLNGQLVKEAGLSQGDRLRIGRTDITVQAISS